MDAGDNTGTLSVALVPGSGRDEETAAPGFAAETFAAAEDWLRRAFALFLLYVGLRMLWRRPPPGVQAPPGAVGFGLAGTGEDV